MALFRPSNFRQFIGNENIKERLQIQLDVHKREKTIFPHVILHGAPGTGKSTLAQIVARIYGAEAIEMTGWSLKRPESMVILLNQVDKIQKQGQKVLIFIDEVHDLSKARLPESAWLPLFEDYKFYNGIQGTILLDPQTGEEFEVVENVIIVEPFTIIGATTNLENLSKPLRDRFVMSCEMEEYSEEDMQKIVKQYIKKRGFKMSAAVMIDMATRSRFNPRTTTALSESCMIRAKSVDKDIITKEIFHRECKAQKIDNLGLGITDRKALQILSRVYPRGMGVGRLASQLLMKSRAFTELYEGYLERIQLIRACNQGRRITQAGLTHLKSYKY